MPQPKYTARVNTALPNFFFKRLMEGVFILVFTLSLYVLLSLVTYSASDTSWSHVKTVGPVQNAGGQTGAYISDILYRLLGYVAYVIPLGFAYLGGLLVQESKRFYWNRAAFLLRTSGLLFLILGGCAFLSLKTAWMGPDGQAGAGGILGAFLADGFDYAFNLQGAFLVTSAALLVGVTWLTGFSWIDFIESIGSCMCLLSTALMQFVKKRWRALRDSDYWPLIPQWKLPFKKENKTALAVRKQPLSTSIRPSLGIKERSAQPILPPKAEAPLPAVQSNMTLPSLSLLEAHEGRFSANGSYTPEILEQLSRDLEQHLLDFGIHVDVVAVHPGPVITRFELQLAAGIKVSRLTALSKDLARALSVTSVRIVEVIPGKTVVGLELPNQQREIVRLSEVLQASVYQQANSPLTLALGVDIAGYPMVVDLAKMPHLLVAGTTGSGKSVGVHAMILSLLFRLTPEQVRLIMVDPKMLELSVYDGIPHLLTPVVTDMREAASALRWCVEEMERRYRLLASLGVRNLAGFNLKLQEATVKGESLTSPIDGSIIQPLPYIVVIIDELADMMMVVGKKVEQLIARIAQKARAAGIHLILATQRPSVDVLTGLIKSNIPTRISFQVSSKIDSRTILDQQGAEQLLGYGDMLFLAPGSGAPLRVHGAFIDDAEVYRVAEAWRAVGEPQYIEEITQLLSDENHEDRSTEESDPLYDEAVAFVVETRKSSISALQRRFKIGYNRSARLVEMMEQAGILGPLEGGAREVLTASPDY